MTTHDHDPHKVLHVYEGDGGVIVWENGNVSTFGVQSPEVMAAFYAASALLPEDAAGLVGELQTLKAAFAAEGDNFGMEVSEAFHNAASFIQSLEAGWAADKARNAALVAVLEPFVRFAEHIAEQKPGWDHDDFVFAGPLHETRLTMKDFRAARVLLNGERKG